MRIQLTKRRPRYISAILCLALFALSSGSKAAPAVDLRATTEAREARSSLRKPQPTNPAQLVAEIKDKSPTEMSPAPQGSNIQDANAIIRSLAPYQNLPGDGNQIRAIDLDVPFDLNKSTLKPSAIRQLNELAAALKSDKLIDTLILIAGHTDATGSAEYNKTLSEKRALAVLRHLEENHQLDPARFRTKGFGEEKLKNSLAPEASENRRVEVVALAKQAETGQNASKESMPETKGDTRVKIEW